jgi:hypothetical protein
VVSNQILQWSVGPTTVCESPFGAPAAITDASWVVKVVSPGLVWPVNLVISVTWQSAESERNSIVAPAVRSPSAKQKDATRKTETGHPLQSFQDLLRELSTLCRCRVRLPSSNAEFHQLTESTPTQRRALELLEFPVGAHPANALSGRVARSPKNAARSPHRKPCKIKALVAKCDRRNSSRSD